MHAGEDRQRAACMARAVAASHRQSQCRRRCCVLRANGTPPPRPRRLTTLTRRVCQQSHCCAAVRGLRPCCRAGSSPAVYRWLKQCWEPVGIPSRREPSTTTASPGRRHTSFPLPVCDAADRRLVHTKRRSAASSRTQTKSFEWQTS